MQLIIIHVRLIAGHVNPGATLEIKIKILSSINYSELEQSPLTQSKYISLMRLSPPFSLEKVFQ